MKLDKTIYTRDSDSFFRKTLQQYKYDYLDILDFYKSKNVDNDEVTFIDYEIGLIKDYIKPVTQNIKTELETKGVLDLEVELNIKPYISSYKKIISFLEAKKSELGNKIPLSHIENKQLKTFQDFVFNINDKEMFVKELKLLFPNEKGKPLKAIINILKTEHILIIGAGEFKAFYEVLKIEFNRNIGTYTSINDVKEIHKDITTPIENKVRPLINKYKTS